MIEKLKNTSRCTATYLIRMGCGDEEDGASSGHAPGTAGVNFAEEQVDEHREGAEKDIIFPIGQRI